MIDFNRPAFTGREFDYIRDAVSYTHLICKTAAQSKKCAAVFGYISGIILRKCNIVCIIC